MVTACGSARAAIMQLLCRALLHHPAMGRVKSSAAALSRVPSPRALAKVAEAHVGHGASVVERGKP